MSFPVLKEVQEFYTDFIGGSPAIACEPFLSSASGTGAVAATFVNSVDPYWGIVSLTSGTAASYANLTIDPSQFILNKRPFRAHVQFQIPTLSVNGTNGFVVTLGFSSAVTGSATAPVSAVRTRIDASNNINTEVYSASAVVGGPNAETPLGTTGLVAGTWYNWYIQCDFINAQTQLQYGALVSGPTVGVRQWLIPDLGLNPSFPGVANFNAFTQGYMGEYPVSILPTANLGFVVDVTWAVGAARSINVNRAYLSAGRWQP